MFQTTNQTCTLTACQHVRTCPAKEPPCIPTSSRVWLWDSRPTPMKNNQKMVWKQCYRFKFPKQHWKVDYSYPNKKRERISMWLTTILMPICFFYLLRGSVPPLFWATTHANVAPRLLDAVGSAMGHEGIAASERRDLDINQSVVGMFHQYP